MARPGSALMGASRKPIKIKPSKVGSLHSALGVPQGSPIPSGTIDSKLSGATGNLRDKLQFAKNARSWK